MTEDIEPDKPMASPLYIAEMKRDQAIREARAVCQAKVSAAYRQLGLDEEAAREAYRVETGGYLSSICFGSSAA